jgi:hypothetical protein
VLPPAQIEPTSEENIPAALYLIGLTQNDEDGDGVVEVDDNCLGTYNPAQTDSDGDTVGAACDCDDTNPAVQPGAEEQCSNSVDDDCDGLTDGDDSDCSSPGWGLAQSAEASADLQGAAPASRVMNVLGAFLLAAICLGGWRLARRRG